MFNKNQLASLNQELDSSRIKTREKGNVSLSYIEGFDVIETANLIFGFGNWDYAISKLEFISSEMNQNQNHVICYKAIVQVLVHSDDHSKDISREDVGFGSGVAKTLADAHENAGKEAVTDALKRAMRSFGNQFGNSLYDKSRNYQNQDSSYQANQNHQQKPNYNQNNSTNTNFKGVGNQQQTVRQNQTNTQTMQQQVQNPNSRNVNQNNQQNNSQQQHSFQNNQSFDQYEYQPLYNLGLEVIEQNGFLIITGDNQYLYRDAIKACAFRFDSKSKTWYKPIESAA